MLVMITMSVGLAACGLCSGRAGGGCSGAGAPCARTSVAEKTRSERTSNAKPLRGLAERGNLALAWITLHSRMIAFEASKTWGLPQAKSSQGQAQDPSKLS